MGHFVCCCPFSNPPPPPPAPIECANFVEGEGNPAELTDQCEGNGSVQWDAQSVTSLSKPACGVTWKSARVGLGPGLFSYALRVDTFGLTNNTIPTDPSGIQIKIGIYQMPPNGPGSGSGLIQDACVKLYSGGDYVGDSKALQVPIPEFPISGWPYTQMTYGDSEDLWGTTRTRADSVQTTFGVGFWYEDKSITQGQFSHLVSVDCVQIRVCWEE